MGMLKKFGKKNRRRYKDIARAIRGGRRRNDEEKTKRREIGELACKGRSYRLARLAAQSPYQ
jgi:hypothetical protein